MGQQATLASKRLESFNASSSADAFETCFNSLGKAPLGMAHFTYLVQGLNALRTATPRKVVGVDKPVFKPRDFTQRCIQDVFSYFEDCADDPKFQRLIGVKLEARSEGLFFMQRPFPLEIPLDEIKAAHIRETGVALKTEENRHFNLVTALSINLSEFLTSAFPHEEQIPIALPAERGLYVGRAVNVDPAELDPARHYFRTWRQADKAKEVHEAPFNGPRFAIVIDRFIREAALTPHEEAVMKHWNAICAQPEFTEWAMAASEVYFHGGDKRFEGIHSKLRNDYHTKQVGMRTLAFHSLMDLFDTRAWGIMQMAYEENFNAYKANGRRPPADDDSIAWTPSSRGKGPEPQFEAA